MSGKKIGGGGSQEVQVSGAALRIKLKYPPGGFLCPQPCSGLTLTEKIQRAPTSRLWTVLWYPNDGHAPRAPT